MDVKHDVTDEDRQPENAEAALRARQAKEDAETIRVRGRQRPADPVEPVAVDQPISAPTSEASAAPAESPESAPRQPSQHSYRRRDLTAEPTETP